MSGGREGIIGEGVKFGGFLDFVGGMDGFAKDYLKEC